MVWRKVLGCDIIRYVKLEEQLSKLLIPDLAVGDLVRLKEDVQLSVGIGLVEELRFNFDDVYDIKYILERLEDDSETLKTSVRDEGFYLTKPQALILWTRKKLHKSNSMWMYTSEITIINKAIIHKAGSP